MCTRATIYMYMYIHVQSSHARSCIYIHKIITCIQRKVCLLSFFSFKNRHQSTMQKFVYKLTDLEAGLADMCAGTEALRGGGGRWGG